MKKPPPPPPPRRPASDPSPGGSAPRSGSDPNKPGFKQTVSGCLILIIGAFLLMSGLSFCGSLLTRDEGPVYTADDLEEFGSWDADTLEYKPQIVAIINKIIREHRYCERII